jgi:hypothetical protein
MPDPVKLSFRLPEDLYVALKERAALDKRSLNKELEFLLSQVLFPTVEADAYRDARRSLRSLPRHTIQPMPTSRRHE